MKSIATAPSPIWRPIVAAGLVVLVLALSVFAVVPEWHETLHADAHQADHECAIVLYSGGVPLTVAITAAPAQEFVWAENVFAIPGDPVLALQKFSLPLSCGPPERV